MIIARLLPVQVLCPAYQLLPIPVIIIIIIIIIIMVVIIVFGICIQFFLSISWSGVIMMVVYEEVDSETDMVAD